MKAAEARAETERVLAQQAAELERKKADMDKREAEREAAHVAQVAHLAFHSPSIPCCRRSSTQSGVSA